MPKAGASKRSTPARKAPNCTGSPPTRPCCRSTSQRASGTRLLASTPAREASTPPGVRAATAITAATLAGAAARAAGPPKLSSEAA
jgi:hypothetical protein